MAFPENLRRLMRERKLSQTSLASSAGISQASISRYLSGEVPPGARELKRLADLFNCSMDELWTGEKSYAETDGKAAKEELAELKRSLRIVFRAMSEPEV